MTPTTDEDEAHRHRVAAHEAGRAIVAQSLVGCGFSVRYTAKGGACSLDGDVTNRDHEVMVAIAGHAAEAVAFGYRRDGEEEVMPVEDYVAMCFEQDAPRHLAGVPVNDAAKAGDDWRRHVPAVVTILTEQKDEHLRIAWQMLKGAT